MIKFYSGYKKMIDIEKAKKEFKEYVKKYDIKNKKVKLKVRHIEAVSNIAKQLAKNLKLSEEDIQLATLIGLLHDIGRFEQIRIYNTFVDKESVNHGELGVKILFEDGLIRNFIEDDSYDKIIKTAILNHNRNLKDIKVSNDRELLHTKIIRDSDKVDIVYFLTFEDKKATWEKEDLSQEIITDEIYRQFIEEKMIDYSKRKTSADILVGHFAYIYDFNYKYSLEIISKNNYYEKIYKRFTFENEQTRQRMETIYQIVEKYLKENR